MTSIDNAYTPVKNKSDKHLEFPLHIFNFIGENIIGIKEKFLQNILNKMASAIPPADESAAVDANIKALEGLLDEFFRDVSNERKAEIERMLAEFSEQVNCI